MADKKTTTEGLPAETREPVVGIDLGTTYSLVAWVDASGRPTTIMNAEGDLTTPSVVFFDRSGVVVGKEAAKAAEFEPERVAQFAKRDMGRVSYHKSIRGEPLPPEAIQALILKKLRDDAELKIGPLKKAVVTVPAYFDEPRRKATEDAGRMAGLDVLDILNEPTAAAISYGVQQGFVKLDGTASDKETVLVYDLGGGTFDVTLMEIEGHRFTALSTAGDVYLGGIDWTDRIVDLVGEKFMNEHNIDPRVDESALQSLMAEAESAKRALTARDEVTLMFAHEGCKLRTTITRAQFEEMTGDLRDRTLFTVRKVLREAKKSWSDVSRLLLVGGSSRMPAVQESLETESGLKVDRSLSPDEAVAHGAAVYASLLAGQTTAQFSDITVKNVNSHDLGVLGVETETGRNRRRIMIPRNTQLPCRANSKFKTFRDGQKSVVVNVVEGGDDSGNNSTAIGKCSVVGLPDNLPAKTPVEVTFRYAKNGRITVEATLPTLNKKVEMVIERASGLDEKAIAYWQERIKNGLNDESLNASGPPPGSTGKAEKNVSAQTSPAPQEKPTKTAPPAPDAQPLVAAAEKTPANPVEAPRSQPSAKKSKQPVEAAPASAAGTAPVEAVAGTEPVAGTVPKKAERPVSEATSAEAGTRMTERKKRRKAREQAAAVVPAVVSTVKESLSGLREKSNEPRPEIVLETPESSPPTDVVDPAPSVVAAEPEVAAVETDASPVERPADAGSPPTETAPPTETVTPPTAPPEAVAEPPSAIVPPPELPAGESSKNELAAETVPTVDPPPIAGESDVAASELPVVVAADVPQIEVPPAVIDSPPAPETGPAVASAEETPPADEPSSDDEPQGSFLNDEDGEDEEDFDPPEIAVADVDEEWLAEEQARQRKRALKAMLVNVGLHAVLLLVLAGIVVPGPDASEIFEIVTSMSDKLENDELEEVVMEQPDQIEDETKAEVVTDVITDTNDQFQIDVNDLAPAMVEIEKAPSETGSSNVAPITGEMGGRSQAGKTALVTKYGGTAESETAVAGGLQWLKRHQLPNGSWRFNHTNVGCDGSCSQAGSLQASTVGATSLALLAFMGAGHTHLDGEHQKSVEAGLNYVLNHANLVPAGLDLRADAEGNGGMYIQGIATICLSEAAALNEATLKAMEGKQENVGGMSRRKAFQETKRLKDASQAAIAFIVNSQNQTGGWHYRPEMKTADTSVVGWQVMALASGKAAKLAIPGQTLVGVRRYLDSVTPDGGSTFGYSSKTPKASTTAIGLLCSMYLGQTKKNAPLVAGVQYLSKRGPQPNDMYYNYYATQVMHHWGGEEWDKWNEVMREQLVSTQVKKGHGAGSWDIADNHGASGGRLYMTCLATMTLEVYYRHLPIYEHMGGLAAK
ncbi:MAG: Hsp70 family protein [Planctomycetota bacterium]|nr:Hsp70 family protein [Planctomycetota bacterium]